MSRKKTSQIRIPTSWPGKRRQPKRTVEGEKRTAPRTLNPRQKKKCNRNNNSAGVSTPAKKTHRVIVVVTVREKKNLLHATEIDNGVNYELLNKWDIAMPSFRWHTKMQLQTSHITSR